MDHDRHRGRRLAAVGFVALTAAVLWGGCGGASAQSACEEACDCVSCSDSELEGCVSQLEESRSRAAEAGCEAEWDEALDCEMSGFVCEGGDLDSNSSCDAENDALRRCAGSVCDEAAEICGAAPDPGAPTAECTGQALCAAECIVDNDSCDVSSTDTPLYDCLVACAS